MLDAGIPLPAVSASMPMPSYNHVENQPTSIKYQNYQLSKKETKQKKKLMWRQHNLALAIDRQRSILKIQKPVEVLR
jgi:hypothetical protein